MRKHSARTSENLRLLINITVVHYGTQVAAAHIRACCHSQQHPPECIHELVSWPRNRTTDFGYIITPFLAPPPLNAKYTPRNARAITINLYDRFTDHRVLSAIWHTKLRGDNFSAPRRARFFVSILEWYFLLQENGSERSFWAAKFSSFAESRIDRRSSIEHETASKTTTRVHANVVLGSVTNQRDRLISEEPDSSSRSFLVLVLTS